MSENEDEKPRQQGRRRTESNDEKELASQQIQIQAKRFYIDVKENHRGKFMKLAEVGVGGRKSRIIMPMDVAAEFKTHLAAFIELNAQTEAKKDNDGLLKSETISKDRKKYYLDLKENQRGRFLKVSMVLNRNARSQIAIPAQGLIEYKDHLSDLLDRFGGDIEENSQSSTHESEALKMDNKTFYFDSNSSQNGSYLRITEVKNRFRSSISIPEKNLQEFKESLIKFIDKTLAKDSASASN